MSMENKPKYYEVITDEMSNRKEGDKTIIGEVAVQLCGEMFLTLRPIPDPRVGWLLIGEKKEFEDGTLFTIFNEKREMISRPTRSYYTSATHYLPPLPVLDGVKEQVYDGSSLNPEKDSLIRAQKIRISELEESHNAIRQDRDDLRAQVLQLEESLRKAEADSNKVKDLYHEDHRDLLELIEENAKLKKSLPTWKKLSEFEGCLPKGHMILGGRHLKHKYWMIREAMCGDDREEIKQSGYTHYYIVPEFKPDNSERIEELKKEIDLLEATFQQELKEYGDCHWALLKKEEKQAELAKLEEHAK